MQFEATHNQTWRKFKSAMACTIAFVSAILVILPLGLVFLYLLINGVGSVNWDFFTKLPAPVGAVGGGMANAMVGTLILLAIAGLIGIPVGVLGGVSPCRVRVASDQFCPAVSGRCSQRRTIDHMGRRGLRPDRITF